MKKPWKFWRWKKRQRPDLERPDLKAALKKLRPRPITGPIIRRKN